MDPVKVRRTLVFLLVVILTTIYRSHKFFLPVLASILALYSILVNPAEEKLQLGEVVRYTLEVSYFSGAPDGVWTDKLLGFNGKYPGPPLEASVGDTLEITVINHIQDGQNTSIHWHGIHQKNFLFEDGMSMISQCPLKVNHSMVYRFKVNQAGTFWYHSHYKSQYTGGMIGALLIHDRPEHYKYDGEILVILTDHYHEAVLENEKWYLSPASQGEPPYVYSGLLNGHGRYPCNIARRLGRACEQQQQLRPVFKVERGKVYRIRLVNAASLAEFHFSIDNHSLTPIEVDGVNVISPEKEVRLVPIAAAQRYSLLFKCNSASNLKSPERFVMRSYLQKEKPVPNINLYPEAVLSDLTGVIECTNEDMSHAKHRVEERTEPFSYKDIPPPYSSLRNYEIDEMGLRPLEGTAPGHYDVEVSLTVDFAEDAGNVRRGSFNKTPFSYPDDYPLLKTLIQGKTIPERVFPIQIQLGSVVQVVINNPPFGAHPFHLHGHHFWIVGLGGWRKGNYDPTRNNLTIQGVKRDTIYVQEKSWAVLRFVADNPGAWLFHCHIDWHNLSGMALTFIVGEAVVKNTTVITDEARRVCKIQNIIV